MAPAVLGYYKIRGLAQHIRFLLEYTGTEYVDKYYDCGHFFIDNCNTAETAKNCINPACWMKEKLNLGLDFPNVPYYIDNEVRLTHSGAIMRYIAGKHNLCGNTVQERARIDMIESEVVDLRLRHWVKMAYCGPDADFEALKAEDLTNLPGNLKKLSDFLGKHKWFAGEKITMADFLVYEILEINRILQTNCLSQFKSLEEFMKRFEDLPAIAKYRQSSKYIHEPINGPMARFSG